MLVLGLNEGQLIEVIETAVLNGEAIFEFKLFGFGRSIIADIIAVFDAETEEITMSQCGVDAITGDEIFYITDDKDIDDGPNAYYLDKPSSYSELEAEFKRHEN